MQKTDENCKHRHSFCEWFFHSILCFKKSDSPTALQNLRRTQTNSLNKKAWLCWIRALGQLKENALRTDKASQHKCPNPWPPSTPSSLRSGYLLFDQLTPVKNPFRGHRSHRSHRDPRFHLPSKVLRTSVPVPPVPPLSAPARCLHLAAAASQTAHWAGTPPTSSPWRNAECCGKGLGWKNLVSGFTL